jgi:hypothetical protein
MSPFHGKIHMIAFQVPLDSIHIVVGLELSSKVLDVSPHKSVQIDQSNIPPRKLAQSVHNREYTLPIFGIEFITRQEHNHGKISW